MVVTRASDCQLHIWSPRLLFERPSDQLCIGRPGLAPASLQPPGLVTLPKYSLYRTMSLVNVPASDLWYLALEVRDRLIAVGNRQGDIFLLDYAVPSPDLFIWRRLSVPLSANRQRSHVRSASLSINNRVFVATTEDGMVYIYEHTRERAVKQMRGYEYVLEEDESGDANAALNGNAN